MTSDCRLGNYADDNTVLVHGSSHEETSDKLALAAQDIINWCKINQMEANPAKFQAMISNETETREIRITDSTVIKTEPFVKLLGVYLDNKLNFGINNSQKLTTTKLPKKDCLFFYSGY